MAELIKENNDVNLLNGKLNIEIGTLKVRVSAFDFLLQTFS